MRDASKRKKLVDLVKPTGDITRERTQGIRDWNV
jgi:hypothetical protein